MLLSRWLSQSEVQTILLVGIVFSIDLSVSLGVASAVPYTFAVLLALKSKRPQFGVSIAITCAILTMAKMVLVPDRGTTELWKVIANRCLALFSITMTLILGILRRQSELRRHMLEQQFHEHQANLVQLGRLSLLGQVAGNLAHELNQPLTAISIHAELAKRFGEKHHPTDTELLTSLQEIVRQSRRAADIIQGVRHLAKRSTQRYETINLIDLTHTVAKLLDWQITQSQVQLTLELNAINTAWIVGDSILLEQVMINLLHNAIDAVASNTPTNRHLTIRLVQQPERYVMYFLDNGRGFDDAVQLFQPFITTKSGGLGLGLAFCRNVIDAHGGRMWANHRPTGGAEFGFWLPIPEESV